MRKENIVFILLITFGTAIMLRADYPKTVSTFNCISVYWSPDGGIDSLDVLVKFRKMGLSKWKNGCPLKYNPIVGTTNDLADYRGSIVNLTPNTTYEIELTLGKTSISSIIEATTWNENFPIAKRIKIDSKTNEFIVEEGGTKEGYILYDGTGTTIDVKKRYKFCINNSKNYVIIRGFTLKNAGENAIHLGNCNNVIIENCDISGWGREEKDHKGFGVDYQGAIYSNSTSLKRIIVQRCLIHHPTWTTNSWSEYRDIGVSEPYHPRGSQAIAFYNSAGNHVFRYNTIWSDKDHMFNDIIGHGENSSYKGFPNSDSDIYGNYLSNCYDDGIESEGANRNVRIWGNYIEKCLIPIGNAPVTIGPLYVWKNTSGKTFGKYSAFIKMGYAGNVSLMQGYLYIFNNTILQPNGYRGIGKDDRVIRHCVIRNNILHVPNGRYSISISSKSFDFSCDFDLHNGKYPSKQEQHGIEGSPEYIEGASFNYQNMTANYFLRSGSPGIDAGEVIPNFADDFIGNAPDMGAFEAGENSMEYGVNAYLVSHKNDKYISD